jgi:hydroxymethylpyrimidine kinase/phosphomethylpyrimidine kinase
MYWDEEGNGPTVLTIAGFDPTGAAGIIADVKTILAFDCTPAGVITSVTFQNARRVFGAIHQTPTSLRDQLLPIIEESGVFAVKTGMLPTREIVIEVARLIREGKLPAPVVDPVLRSSSGYPLMEEDAIEVLINELLPLARVITPNIPEAEQLTGMTIDDEESMAEAAAKLREMGARAALIKGGHLPEQEWGANEPVDSAESDGDDDEFVREAVDLLDDDGVVTAICDEWINAPNFRGTGCILSSGIAAGLAGGKTLADAADLAKVFVSHCMAQTLPSSLE